MNTVIKEQLSEVFSLNFISNILIGIAYNFNLFFPS